jgi:S1-C subfamily serine protease
VDGKNAWLDGHQVRQDGAHDTSWIATPLHFEESGSRAIDVRGAALRAGIRPRDLILAVNEFPVTTVAEFEAILAAIPIGRSPACWCGARARSATSP